jgi:N-methylhydantoinase A
LAGMTAEVHSCDASGCHLVADRMQQKRLAVDIGGTFTDIVIEAGAKRWTRKLLTTPQAPEQAVIAGTLELLAEVGFTAGEIDLFLHGTTLATNAIIERKGAVTALIATEGFRDILDIADEGRYDQYDIFIDKPKALVPRFRRFTVPERIDAAGKVLKPLEEAAVLALLPELDRLAVSSVAVAFLHSYADAGHERRVREMLAEARPGLAVTLSSEVCPEVREYERTSTAVANAYVQPMMAGYLGRLGEALETQGFRCPVYLMTSGGGLTTLETARRFPIRLVESGPAGGAILASFVAAECAENKVLSFDMGGTTAKICLIENLKPQASRSFEVDRAARFLKGSGLPLRIPVIEMVEIGAGGGSLAHVDAMGRITVGPESAGAEPGPACYGRGGSHPTVTDADLMLGRIDPARFAAGRLPLDGTKAAAALTADIGAPLSLTAMLAGYGVAEIVDENMANAARVHSVERGKVIAEHSLIAFGGAAPLHAARLAEKLAIARVIVPPNAGVGSAVGFLRAPIAFEVVRSRYMRLSAFEPAMANAIIAEMREEALEVVRAGAGNRALIEPRSAFMRYVGQGHEIVVPLPVRDLTPEDAALLRETFEGEYRALFSRIIPHGEVEILTWSLTVSTAPEGAQAAVGAAASLFPAPEAGRRRMFDPDTGGSMEVPVYWRPDLGPGAQVKGPALIAEDETTTFVTAAFDAVINAQGCIVLDRRAALEDS